MTTTSTTSTVAVRRGQMMAVQQLLTGKPLGHSRPELQSLLGKHADPHQLTATINAMKSNGVIIANRASGCVRYTLHSADSSTGTQALGTTPERTDHARARAARLGMRAAIPPRQTGGPITETVEQWMTRTGKKPDTLPHNFDNPRTTFPGRRPSINQKRHAA